MSYETRLKLLIVQFDNGEIGPEDFVIRLNLAYWLEKHDGAINDANLGGK